MRDESARAGGLLEALLAKSRAGVGRSPERSVFELAAVIEQVMAESEALSVKAEIGISSLVSLVDTTVFADRRQVESVLRNLLSNALKYSPAGGEIAVQAGPGGDGLVEVVVRDQGLGIPEEWVPQLFQRFSRVETSDRAAIGGTGLGLYIARELVELNGGTIWVENNTDEPGCAFHFTLRQAPGSWAN
jgi:two-component system sensor histidine kinase VicK